MPASNGKNNPHSSAPFVEALINTITELSHTQGQTATALDKIDAHMARLEATLQSLRDGFGVLEDRSQKMSAQHYDESHLSYEFVHELKPKLEAFKDQLSEIRGKKTDISKENMDLLIEAVNLSLERFCPASEKRQCQHIYTSVDDALDAKLPLLKILTSKWLGAGVIILILGLLSAILVLIGVRTLSLDQQGLRFETQAVQDLRGIESKIDAIQHRLRAVEVESATD